MRSEAIERDECPDSKAKSLQIVRYPFALFCRELKPHLREAQMEHDEREDNRDKWIAGFRRAESDGEAALSKYLARPENGPKTIFWSDHIAEIEEMIERAKQSFAERSA